MNLSDIQMLLAERGWYIGAIDGDVGPKTWVAVARAEKLHGAVYCSDPAGWPDKRRLVGAAQAALQAMGFEPGAVDGYAGHNTTQAAVEWRSKQAGSRWQLDRSPVADARSHDAQQWFPRQSEMETFYGPAGGAQCTAGKVALAFPMIIAWNRSQIIRSFCCHSKVEKPLTGIYQQVLAHYGQADIERLELNVFGGCYNFRKMRGGRSLSTHAYGAAVDHNPEKNQLRWGADRAQFARPEYVSFWNIVMAHGGTPAGYAWGRDWMHFQFARL